MDRRANFSTFVMDGATTSRQNHWAVGEKGKGFNLATQYLYEQVEKNLQEVDAVAFGRSSENETQNLIPNWKQDWRTGLDKGPL